MLPRIRLDRETQYAYVYFAEPHPGIAKITVPLDELVEGKDVETLHDLVLDFDSDGRLVGIEILGPAARVLRPEALAHAEG